MWQPEAGAAQCKNADALKLAAVIVEAANAKSFIVHRRARRVPHFEPRSPITSGGNRLLFNVGVMFWPDVALGLSVSSDD